MGSFYGYQNIYKYLSMYGTNNQNALCLNVEFDFLMNPLI
jgi:hypothetical protein